MDDRPASINEDQVARIAGEIFAALRSQDGGHAYGRPSRSQTTMIDGVFDLTLIAESLLVSVASGQSCNQTPDRD